MKRSATASGANTWGSRLPWVGWGGVLLLLVVLLCSGWQGPDIFYHLNLGKQILATGRPQPPETVIGMQPGYVNVYWIYQVVSQLLYSSGGPVAVSLFMVAVWVGFFVVCWRIARAFRFPAVGLPLALASILIVQGRFDPRPDGVAWHLVAVLVYWLTTWDFSQRLPWRKLALAGVVQVVWTNVHGYFAFGPLLVAAFLVARVFDAGGRARYTEIGKLLAVVLVASFISPFGFRGWGFVFDLWRLGGQMRDSVVEVRPPTREFMKLWTVKLFWGYWGAVILLMALLLWKKRAQVFPLILVLTGLFLSARSVRYVPALVIFSAPAWGLLVAWMRSRSAMPMDRGQGAVRRGTVVLGGVTALVGLLLSVWVVSGGYYRSLSSPARFGITLPTDAYPTAVARYLREGGFSGKIFNDSSDGGYIPYVLPGIRVYMDPRYVDPPIVAEYFSALDQRERFDALHRQHAFDGVLLKISESPRLLMSLLGDPHWRLAYADLHRAFLIPAGREGMTQRIRFYENEDLGRLSDGRSAIEWTVMFARMKNREMLLQVLEDTGRSAKVPSFMIQYALGFGMQEKDAEIIAKGRSMYPRMVTQDPKDKATVDRLMMMTSGGTTRTR